MNAEQEPVLSPKQKCSAMCGCDESDNHDSGEDGCPNCDDYCPNAKK